MAGSSTTARALAEARRVLDEFASAPENAQWVDSLAAIVHERFGSGRKVMICGNGGSACDAMHFAEELTGRFREDRAALPAMACTDFGHITCTANDYGFEHVYSRWVEALGREGDVLIVLSTSGNSANLVRAVESGRSRKMTTVAMLGKTGGALRGMCDYELVVPGGTSDRIQELHMLVLHILVEAVEGLMGDDDRERP